MNDVILGVIVLVPLALTYLIKSNAALAFLVLCADFVLITFASADIKDLTHNLKLEVNNSTLNLIILGAPFLLTLLLVRKSFAGKLTLFLQSVIALCAGALLALIAIPLLNQSVRSNFADSWGWTNLQKIQAPVIVTGAILSLLLYWAHKPKAKFGKKHK